MVHLGDEKFLLNLITGMTNSCTVGYVLGKVIKERMMTRKIEVPRVKAKRSKIKRFIKCSLQPEGAMRPSVPSVLLKRLQGSNVSQNTVQIG